MTNRWVKLVIRDCLFLNSKPLCWEKRIDLAVHSAKDLPQRLAEGLEILAVPERADARDVLVQVKNKLPKAPVIGTGSLRRRLYVVKNCGRVHR